MGMVRENQVRHIYVAGDFPGHATIAELRAGANLDLAALKPDGTAVANNSELMLALKNHKGTVTNSDVINPGRVLYANLTAYEAPVAKVVTIDDIVVEAGKLYTTAIVIAGHGSLSAENEYVKEGFYKAKTGDDVEKIVDGLIKSLSRSFTREPNAPGTTTTYTIAGGGTIKLPDNTAFAFSKTGTGANAALVITEKNWLPEYYVTGKKDRLFLDFRVETRFPQIATVTAVEGKIGKGTGFQVRKMEYYLVGNRQDSLRGAGYPHNFEEVYTSDVNANYNVIEIGYYDESRNDPMKSKKQVTVVIPFTDLASNADTNALVGEINKSLLATGIILPTLPVV